MPIRYGPAGAQFSGGQDSTDPSPEVVRLNADLLAAEEILTASLDEAKVVYVFEGVSNLISSVLMDSAVNVRKMNKNGVKKMCRNIFSINNALSANVTGGGRETSLDQAKQYYEMMNQRAQDVLNDIVERGPVFSLERYERILELLHRSNVNSTVDIHNKYVEKLREIVRKGGVTV